MSEKHCKDLNVVWFQTFASYNTSSRSFEKLVNLDSLLKYLKLKIHTGNYTKPVYKVIVKNSSKVTHVHTFSLNNNFYW